MGGRKDHSRDEIVGRQGSAGYLYKLGHIELCRAASEHRMVPGVLLLLSGPAGLRRARCLQFHSVGGVKGDKRDACEASHGSSHHEKRPVYPPHLESSPSEDNAMSPRGTKRREQPPSFADRGVNEDKVAGAT